MFSSFFKGYIRVQLTNICFFCELEQRKEKRHLKIGKEIFEYACYFNKKKLENYSLVFLKLVSTIATK